MNPHRRRTCAGALAALLLSLSVIAPVLAEEETGLPLERVLSLLFLDSAALPPGVHISLTLGSDGTLGGSSGCNSYSGSYQVEGESLSVGPIRSTLMACQEPAMTTEARYLDLLGRVGSWGRQGADLALLAADGATLVFEIGAGLDAVDPHGAPTALLDTRWVLESIGAVGISMPAQPELLFDGEGNLAGSAGCNRFFGRYGLEGDLLTVESLATTRVRCPDRAVAEVERTILAMLSLPMHWHIEGYLLVLADEAGSLSITFRADG